MAHLLGVTGIGLLVAGKVSGDRKLLVGGILIGVALLIFFFGLCRRSMAKMSSEPQPQPQPPTQPQSQPRTVHGIDNEAMVASPRTVHGTNNETMVVLSFDAQCPAYPPPQYIGMNVMGMTDEQKSPHQPLPQPPPQPPEEPPPPYTTSASPTTILLPYVELDLQSLTPSELSRYVSHESPTYVAGLC